MLKRRCYYFDDDGTPLDECPRGDHCAFPHPTSKDWADARSSHRMRDLQKQERRRDRDYDHRDRDVDRERDRDRDRRSPPRHRGRSRNSSSARSPSGSRRRRDHSRTMDNSRTDRRQMSLDKPESSKAIPFSQEKSISSTASTPQRPATATTGLPSTPSNIASSPVPPAGPKALLMRRPAGASRMVLPPTPISVLIKGDMPIGNVSKPPQPQPQPPKEPPPINPPLPVPELPKNLTLEIAPPVSELDPKAKLKLWEGRIKLLAECVESRFKLQTLEDEYKSTQQVTESNFFSSLPDQVKRKLEDQCATAQNRLFEGAKRNREIVEKLLDEKFWPVEPRQSSNSIQDDAQEQYQEVMKFVRELYTTAKKMNFALNEVASSLTPKTPAMPFSSSDDRMDVDRPSISNNNVHDKKRRRVSADETDGPTVVREQSRQEISLDDLKEQLELIEYLEDRVSTVENDLIQNENQRQAEMLVHMTDMLQKRDDKMQEEAMARDRARNEIQASLESKILQQQGLISKARNDIDEIAINITEFAERLPILQHKLDEKLKEREASHARMLSVEQRLKEFTSARNANQARIQTLQAALDAYTTRPPSPPASPLAQGPVFDNLVSSLEQPVLEAVREHLKPMVVDLKENVTQTLKQKNEELYTTVWTRISTTMKLLEMVRARIDNDGAALNAANTSTVAPNALVPTGSSSPGGVKENMNPKAGNVVRG